MITKEQATEYLESVGVALPEFLLDALLAQMETINDCLDANYAPAIALLIQSYLLGLLGLAQGDRYISSQTAPSGASRSFRYMAIGDRWKALTGLLRNLDKFGCATGLIPTDPTQKAFGGIWIAKGGCVCGDER